MNDKIFTSVWRGLDPYREEDADSFFGRDTEADQLCSDVAQTPLCVVYGASGSGKTSLIRAGLFPRLRSCGFIPVYVLFDHSSTARPFAEQIKSAVLEAVKTAHCDTVEVCAPISNARQETLWEWFHRHEFVNAFRQTVRPVVVIDQFEEVFTVGEERGGTDALLSDIADLAENYVPDVVVRDMEKSEAGFGFTADEQNWRIVVGLREDFLPRLEERTQKLPVFRRTRFVVGAFRREQALEVVTGPGGTLCGREVAEAIVDAVGKTKAGASVTVEPALLSLFCMRLDRARQEASLDEITFSLVRDKGKDILNTFYEESMSGVSGKTRDILEDWLLTSSGFRDSMAIEDAEAEGAPREELARLVRDRLLHVEYRGGVRWLELSHDILAPVAREAKERHARKREMAHVKKKMNFFKRIAAFLFGGVVIFLVLLQVWWFVFNKPYSSVYRDFVRCWGNPVGIGTPLKEIEWRHRQYSYRLHRHGALWYWNLVRRRNPPSHRIEIINGQGELSQLCWFGTEFGTDDDEGEGDTGDATTLFDKLKTVCVITFEYDKTGRPECEKGWDKEGNHIWTKKYDQFFEGEADWKKQDARFSYVWPDGLPMPIKNGLQAFVRISYDEQGRESRRILLDAFGKIMKNTDGQESIAITYDKMGRLVSQSSQNLGEHGIGWTNILDKAGNTGMKVIYAPDWSSEEWVSFGTGGETDLHPTTEGIARHIHRFDSYGNEINIVYLGVDGCPITGPYGFSEIRMYYGEDGTRTQEDLLSWDEKGVLGFTNVQHMVVNRNANGDVTRECFFDMNDKPVAGANGVPVIKRRFEEHGLLAEEWYEDGYGNPATNAAGIAKTAYQYSNGLQRRSDEYALPNMGGVGGFSNVHHRVVFFDEHRNYTNLQFFAVGDIPACGENNAHSCNLKYGKFGTNWCCVEEWYLDEDGQAAITDDGVVRRIREYDTTGEQMLLDSCFASKNSCGIKAFTNVYFAVFHFDDKGNLREERYTDANIQPVAGRLGYWRAKKTFYDNGQPSLAEAWAPPGKGGIFGNTNLNHYVLINDEAGNEVARFGFDAEGMPTDIFESPGYVVSFDQNGKSTGKFFIQQ